ncbi:hypothetical protein GLP59_10150 [Sulfitobacter sp. M220]|uniref:hypothetical protein n=1 Tax=Sulfitobacter TaxID=60136 RepID=UPI001F9C01F3|nr:MULTISPECIES: hypothetical protein [unclassified Sulfitobacter]MCF7726660.1 hypothetical protein [Sulfitobacter sp. M22]MCF7778002.1 hypothetical protein [Sulfitobacter sp. M220]
MQQRVGEPGPQDEAAAFVNLVIGSVVAGDDEMAVQDAALFPFIVRMRDLPSVERQMPQ